VRQHRVPEDDFCGECGARVPPNAPDAAPPQDKPTLVNPAPSVTAGGRNLRLAMLIGAGVVLLLANPPKPTDRKEAAAGAPDTTLEHNNAKTTIPKSAGGESAAVKKTQPQQAGARKQRETAPEEASGPSPGYNPIQTPDGSLSAEVPPR
jgi:hypothetical protein